MKLTYEEVISLEPKIKAVIQMAESQAFRCAKSPEDLDEDSRKIIFATHHFRKNLETLFDAARIEAL